MIGAGYVGLVSGLCLPTSDITYVRRQCLGESGCAALRVRADIRAGAGRAGEVERQGQRLTFTTTCRPRSPCGSRLHRRRNSLGARRRTCRRLLRLCSRQRHRAGDDPLHGGGHEVYRPLYLNSAPLLFCHRRTSELIKHAGNAFLAMKVIFINEMADLWKRSARRCRRSPRHRPR